MGKVQCIFGDIYFSRNIAFVYHIDKKEYIEAELAEEYCQKKIESNEYQTYAIPDLYYSDVRGDKGKVDYRFCDNNPKRKKMNKNRRRCK